VAVVTFDGPNGRQGLTVNSFTSVSMRPPLVLVSIVKTARSHDALPGLAFCVNILGAEQEPIARRFAGRDQSAVVRWMESPRAPRIRGAAAHIECVPWRTYDGGDHRLFVGEVVDFASREGDLLGYVGSRFTTIAEPHLGVEYLI
jgi:flavin reductase (DIM6/NTAB) family NADH-FMN oxidoreductase RutF